MLGTLNFKLKLQLGDDSVIKTLWRGVAVKFVSIHPIFGRARLN